MRALTENKALLLAAFLGILSHLVLGTPIVTTAETTDAYVFPHDDGFYPELLEDISGLEVRMTIPKPPPLPEPFVPPSVSVPKPKPIQPPAPPRLPTPPRPAPPSPKPNAEPIPVTVNPGAGPGLGVEPKPMDSYAKAGKNQMTSYEAIMKSDRQDTAIVQTEAELAKFGKNEAFLNLLNNDQYKLDTVFLMREIPQELKNFKSGELGFDIKSAGRMKQTTVRNNDKAQGEIINRGIYDTDGRFIIYQDALKGNDKATGAKKTPLNEMGMQNFKDAAGDKTKNFKAAFLMDIQNKEFWAITRQNYNDKKQPFDQILTFERGTPQFDRYMGSPNFNSKFYSFANHHNAIGNKVPDKVIVIPKQAENSGGKLTVAVIFKDA